MRRTGASLRALRYYEEQGLVVPARHPNGYRDYGELAVEQVRQIRELTRLGLRVEQTRPFVECLASGHLSPDECVSSLAAYRSAIDGLTERIDAFTNWRSLLQARLDDAAGRGMPEVPVPPAPGPAPSPVDVTRLTGRPLPMTVLPSTGGDEVCLGRMPRRSVIYFYPLTGRPGVDLPEGWDTIPGARGCTEEACGFRDHHAELLAAGAGAVYGLSSQPTPYQTEVARRLRLPYDLLSDPALDVAGALGLPTFDAGPHRLYTRLTLVVDAGAIAHVWHPVGSPGAHAGQVLAWLRDAEELAS
ncbi:Peroxiredoxin [Jiangella alba]|uniref:Peroxiredoxin n=2 Tax=Jiangella alba TaxID=561176 RepID=A0A1H5PZE2_9ACTN|nr:Peroxiredoxin [Jiangella alba]